MNHEGTRDLRWWHIPGWAPSEPRTLTTGLFACLVIGLGVGLGLGILPGLMAGLVAGLLAAGFGEGGGIPVRTGRVGLREIARGKGRWAILGISLGAGLLVALGFGFVAVYMAGFVAGIVVALVAGLMAGLTAGLAAGLIAGFVAAYRRSGAGQPSSLTPIDAWRNDRAYWRAVGLACSFAAVLLAGIGLGLGLAARADLDFASVIAVGLTVGLIAPRTWATSLTFIQLAESWRTPIRIMRLLEDARQRDVLRTIGPIYQFRHARLQDRLAELMPPPDQR
jgi:hypothetical protein